MVFSICNKRMMQRKAVSQVLGSLFMLAIVAGLGSVLLFQGVSGINNFNTSLIGFQGDKESASERLIVEHVRFNPTNKDVTISIRNTGTVEVTIDVITMINVDRQELLINDIDREDLVLIKDFKDITLTANLLAPTTKWSDNDANNYKNGEYRISITTIRGNSFETVARPASSFNT